MLVSGKKAAQVALDELDKDVEPVTLSDSRAAAPADD
jgi:thiamine thiazole synthase